MSGLTGSPLLRPAELLASLQEAFTSGLSTGRSPSPSPGITTMATGRFPPAGLPPAGSAASVAALVHRFHQLGLRFPRRAYGGAWDGKLIWGRLTHSRVIGVLANPSYAGTYVFGRYQSCKKIDATGEICSQVRRVPEDQWRVVIPDHHPGYISPTFPTRGKK